MDASTIPGRIEPQDVPKWLRKLADKRELEFGPPTHVTYDFAEKIARGIWAFRRGKESADHWEGAYVAPPQNEVEELLSQASILCVRVSDGRYARRSVQIIRSKTMYSADECQRLSKQEEFPRAELIRKVAGRIEVALRPQWDAERGLLFYRGEVVREVAKQAGNVSSVLSSFESEDWPERIETPAHINGRDAVKSLNDKLSGLRFTAAKGSIGWAPENSPASNPERP